MAEHWSGVRRALPCPNLHDPSNQRVASPGIKPEHPLKRMVTNEEKKKRRMIGLTYSSIMCRKVVSL
jgi:hypothetical protein